MTINTLILKIYFKYTKVRKGIHKLKTHWQMSEKLCFKLVLLMWWTMSIFSFIGHILTELFGKTDNWQKIYKQTSLTFYTSNNVPLKWVEKKKLLGCNSKEIKNLLNFTTLQNGCLISFKKNVFMKLKKSKCFTLH